MGEETRKRIGDYEILNELGAGGMGKVYRVRNVIFDRIEAMKVLLPDLAGRQELADRFLREIKLMASLNHSNIAQLRTAFAAENQLVMIMEFLEGTNLAQRVERGPIPVADAVNYISQALSALGYAHQHGVIHRDIKPSNMMLTPQGVIKLMDFGIARGDSEKKLTMSGTTLGSIGYMSPEQVKGEATDARSDLYSTGISLYEMVTGRRPFQEASDYNIMAAHVKEKPKPPVELQPGLPAVLNEIILMSIAKNPAQRFQTADAMRNALSTVKAESVAPPARVPSAAELPTASSMQQPGMATTVPGPFSFPDVTAPMAAAERTYVAATSAPDATTVSALGTPNLPPTIPVTPLVPPAPPLPATAPMAAARGFTQAVPSPAPPATPPPAAPRAATPIPAIPIPAAPLPPPSSGHRGLYMTLGALVVLAGLVVAGLYLPNSSRTHAKDLEPGAAAPASTDAGTAAQPAPPAVPAAGTPIPDSGQPACGQPSQPAPPSLAVGDNAPAAQPQVPQPAMHAPEQPSLGQGTPTPTKPRNLARRMAPSRNTMGGGGALPQTDAGSAPQPTAEGSDSLDEVEHEVDQLSNRAAAVSSSLNRLQQQGAAGYGLRGDMVERGASMNNNLARAEEAVRRGDLAKAKRFSRMAENDIEVLEKFLGQ
jgi:eukaryotic-like serine/threonine-protein kinase